MLVTYSKHPRQEGFFIRLVDGVPDGSVIPDDMDNRARQELQDWLEAGNVLEQKEVESTLPVSSYNWIGLAVAFKLSQFNKTLDRVKDEGLAPSVNAAIWRLSDDITQVITISVFPDDSRVGRLHQDLLSLLAKLEEGKIPISSKEREEIVKALQDNGFGDVASAVSQSSGTV